MGKIVSNFFISLDGVVEAPDQWHFDYWSDEMGEIVGAGVAQYEAFMMGRRLYDEWSQYWPAQAGDQSGTDELDNQFATFLNAVPKYVVSNTLTGADWNNTTVVSGDAEAVAARLREIKAETTRDIGISGSATLVRSLLEMGVLDQLSLLVHPVAVGQGQRLFENTPKTPLRLVSSKTIENGVLHLVYEPATG